jgi:hypothetical protein
MEKLQFGKDNGSEFYHVLSHLQFLKQMGKQKKSEANSDRVMECKQ